jgi:hypothetical protein
MVNFKPEDQVVLGFGGAWGFAPADLTSPARAAEAGAFTDSTLPGPDGLPFTELRVHGVSGSNGPTMLEHPHALQVAGDSTTMFYRRWTPAGSGGEAVPWRLEAYSWGGLTEAPLASAAWVLMTPFMLYNVAHFALPPAPVHKVETIDPSADGRPDDAHRVPAKRLSRDRSHAFGQVLLRILAFTATLQLTTAVVSIFVNAVALQARRGHFPTWLTWYPKLATEWRIALAVALVAEVIAAMWWISVKTASRYEARSTEADPIVNAKWPLTQSGFWKSKELVRRHRDLHAAGAAAITAMILARPAHHMGPARVSAMVVAVAVLLAVVVTLCLPLADRHDLVLGEASTDVTRGTWWCRALLAVGAAVFVAAAFTRGWPDETGQNPVAIPGFTNECAFLAAVQALLLAALALAVWRMVRRAPAQAAESNPFFRGHLTTLLAVLAVCLGGLFGALVNLFVTRIIGTPVPSGIDFNAANLPPKYALQIPWPIYAFTAAPIGLIVGLIVAGVIVALTWRRHTRAFVQVSPQTASPVAAYYGSVNGDPDDEQQKSNRKKVAGAWAIGQLVDQAALVAGFVAAGMFLATIGAEVNALLNSRQSSTIHGFAAAESLIGLFFAGLLVGLLRSAYSNPSKRKTIGALWDVGTFWPRAAHPFAPPCYAERAVPELVDRTRILTGTVEPDDRDPAWAQIQAHIRDATDTPNLTLETGPLLLTGYSQGSVIAPAVIAQLPATTRGRVALLTLACPARRLYGRAFPGYFGTEQIRALGELLATDDPEPGKRRWKNLVRRSDYIGSWLVKPPLPTLDRAQLYVDVDQPCWDPVTVAADVDPNPPPVHRHSGFWQDPRVTQLGCHLGRVLTGRASPSDGHLPTARDQRDDRPDRVML